jgi:RNA polymerase sigma-70 factor (ECF subfamily)
MASQRRRVQGHELSDFEAFYAKHGDRLYRFCYRLCGRAADAEDLTQEVFLAAYQGIDRFEGRASVATWLYRIALYRWRLMRQSRGPETVSVEEGEARSVLSTDPEQAGLDRISLDRALDSLPDELREAFLLVKAEGMKYREAATVLGIPQGTIQYRVFEAVARLRVLLRTTADEPDLCLPKRT